MRTIIIATLLLTITGTVSSSFSKTKSEYTKAYEYLEKKGEVYYKFKINDKPEIHKLTHIISIDKVSGNDVYAYANKEEFNNFLLQNLNYEVLTHPGDLLQNPKMSDFKDRNNREWDSYPTYQGYLNLMSQFEADYPSLCKVVEIGQSVLGRKLLCAKISDNVNTDEAEPKFFYTSTIHGDETTGYVLMLHLIDSLLSGYANSSRIKNLVDNIEIWINPLANPDGTYRSGDSTVAGARRYNANNRDLNRDFPYVNPKTGMRIQQDRTESETQAFIDLGDTYPFVMTADMHGGAELIYYPWGCVSKATADEDWLEYVCTQYAEGAQANGPSGYFNYQGDGVVNGYDWYMVQGERMNYVLYYQLCRAVTIELSSQKLLSESQLNNYWNYNYRSLLNYLEQVLYGINGTVADSKTGDPLKAKVFVENHDIDNSHVYSKLPHGDYYRPIIAGTYDVTFSCDDYHPKTISNVIVENNKATVLNVELFPNVSINVSSPNGGETLYVGENYDISWLSHNSVGDVNIEYSINNGVNWSLIAGTTDNDGLYTWTVPDEPSTTCLIRIYEVSTNDPIDTSDNVFTISSPVIELSSPNGGEVLYEGDSHTITWINKGLIGNVDIEYSIDNGQNWLTIANNIANSGSHLWTIPGNPSSSCKIRISETADGDPVDVSDNVFTLSPPVIELSSPNGGEAWYIGKSYNITWSTKGFVGDVKIEYSTNNGSNWSDIITSTANDGSHSWTIPDKSSELCKVRISEASDGDPFDESNGTFIIEIEPSITLSFPVGSEVLYIDTFYTIRWSVIGRVGDVKIEYSMNDGAGWSIITNQTENNGLYDWQVPEITPGTCKIRISEASDGVPSDVGNSFFIEYAPSITVSHPNGGEVLYIGMVYKIQWVNKGTVGDIKIDYSTDNGASWKVVVTRITNTASYNWKIPDDESDSCRIRISEASNDDIIDISDNTFSIAPPFIKVSVPNGGEVWYTGYSHDITWSGEGFLGDVKIEYSTDNGSNWKVIAENTGNNGMYSWVVPNEPSPSCRVRVSESANANPVDESDAAFEIEFGTAIQDGQNTPNKFNGSFDIVPNPVNNGFNQKVTFKVTPTESIQDAIIEVYDPLGSIVYESDKMPLCNANQQYTFHPWYLKNISGRSVAGGSYLAVLMARDKDGKAVVVKRMVGVKDN